MPTSKKELQDQLGEATKLNNVMRQMSERVAGIEQSYTNQVQKMEELSRAINQVDTQQVVGEIGKLTDSVKDLVGKMEDMTGTSQNALHKLATGAGEAGDRMGLASGQAGELQQAMRDIGSAVPSISGVTDAIEGTIGKVQGLSTAQKKLDKIFGKWGKTAFVGISALSGLVQGFKNVIALSSSVGGFVSTFIKGLGSIAAAIIAIPLKIFTGLVDMAANASHGSNELLQAIEDLRKEFGNLRGPTNRAIMDISTSFKGFEATGLSTFRVFGMMHERLNMLRELFVELGPTFQLVKEEMHDNAGALLAYQKGLGIANEEMGNIIIRAKSMGVNTADVLNAMTKQTLSLGKAFGESQKVIGKDMAKAMNDVAHFGSLAVEEIAQASIYARKLGIELDKITGTLDAFETFDSAADNVATLSQAFGVQLDTFKLVQAESPADIVDQLRKSFAAAGHDAKNFNRQQLKLVSQMTGLDEATAKAAFSLNNQGMSLDDIKKKSQEAEKKQMSQAEAMSKLADSIERLVKTGGGQTGGFWDMFIKGLMGGLQYSKEFRGIIWNIKRGLYAVFRIGFQLGRVLPKIIPDLGKALGGIKEFFDPKKFSKLFGGISEIVRDFFAEGGDDKGNVPRLLEKLKEKFEDFFTSQGPAAKKIIEGFKGMMKLISNIVADIIPVVAEHITKAIKFVTALITGKKKLTGAQGAAEGGLGFLADLITPIWDALKAAWPMLWNAIKELWAAAWPHIKKGLFAIAQKAGPWIAATLFGPALTRAALGALTASLTSAALRAIGKVFSRGGAAEKGLEGAINKLSQKIGEMSKGASPGDAVKKAGETAAKSQKAQSQVAKVNWKALGAKLIVMFAALAMGLAAFWVVLKMTKDKKREEIINAGIAMGVALTTAAGAAGIAAVVQKALAKPNWKALAVGLIAVGLTVVALGGVTYLMMKILGKFSPTKMLAVGKVMLQMSLVFLAMVPLLAAATAIGALIIGTKGTIIIAAGAGMMAIGAAVGQIGLVTAGIIKEVSALKIGPDFQVKIDAFLGIMKSLQAFADTLVSVLKLMMPTFTEFITGTAESFSTKVDSAVKLIQEMVGQKGKGKGIIGLVEIVIDTVKSLPLAEGIEKQAGLFASILQSVTELMKALTPPDAFYEAGSSFLVQMGHGDYAFADLANQSANFMEEMRRSLTNMIEIGVLPLIKKVTTIDIPNPESAKIVVDLMKTLASMMGTLSPSPELMKSFMKIKDDSWGPFSEKIQSFDAAGAAKVIGLMQDQMNKLLPVLGAEIGKIVDRIKGFKTADLKGLEVLGTIISAVSGIAGAIAPSLKGTSKVKELTTTGSWKETINLAPDLGKALASLKSSLPKLVEAIINVANIKGLSEAQDKLKMVGNVFDILGKLPSLMKAMASGGKGGTAIDSNAIVGQKKGGGLIGELTTIFKRLVDDYGENPLKNLLTAINRAGATIQGAGGGKNAKKIGGDLVAIMDGTSKLLSSAATVAKRGNQQIKTGGLKPAIDAVNDIVASANKLNNALAEAPPLELTAGLKKVAEGAGLGGRANYSIKNKGVKINIVMNVKMDAGKVEDAMVMRAESVIFKGINAAATGDPFGPPLTPNTDGSTWNPQTKP